MDSYSWRGIMLAAFAVSGFIGFPQLSFAQNAIAPDKTLPVNTVINFNSANQTYTITGGTQVGTNQFHSFQEFSVPTANTAHFDNALTTANVIGRVTGHNISDIDGTLRTNGTTNLYLINPNGIIFGANAKLDIAGSFSASTANSIKFSDGSEFSATNPQAPPLLQVNMPLGLQYGKSNPAPVSNAGNLTVGGNLTLSGSSVTSTGTLNALQGNLQLDAVAGNVNVSQFQAGTATLTATQGVLLENGKFQTTGDLRLLAKDTVVLQDSAAKPLNLQVGGDLLLQGDRAVTVNTLAHTDSSLWVGKNVLLRSDNPIAIDAHWNGGGNFRVEKINGLLGDIYSSNDPVFQFSGDFAFGSYTGASLQILAGGSVIAVGTIEITGAGNPFNNGTVTLSDGSSLNVNGTTRPVLDIRAGVMPSAFFPSPAVILTGAPTSADIFIGFTTFSNTIAGSDGLVLLTNQFTPNNALVGDVFVGGISTINSFGNAGSVFIDSRGSITSGSNIFTFSVAPSGNGGRIALLAKNNISFGNDAIISSSASYLSGQIDLKSNGAISGQGLRIFGNSIASTIMGNSGDINITASSLSLKNSSTNPSQIGTETFGTAKAGNIILNIIGNATFEGVVNNLPTQVISRVSQNATGNGGLISVRAETLKLQNGAQISANTEGLGKSGDVEVFANTINIDGKINGIASGITNEVSSTANANGGKLTLNTDTLTVTNEGLISTLTSGNGNAGELRIIATGDVIFDRSTISSAVNSSGVGKGGDLFVSASTLQVINGAQIGAGVFGLGDGGKITINADIVSLSGKGIISGVTTESAIATIVENSTAIGNAGDIELSNRILSLRNDSFISASNFGQGNTGNIDIRASESVSINNSSIGNEIKSTGMGKGGDLNITAPTIIMSDHARVSSATKGIGDAGNINFFTQSLSLADISIISASVFPKGKGNAGNLSIIANSLHLLNGSQIGAGIFGEGDSGQITIRSETIALEGSGVLSSGTIVGSGIYSSVDTNAIGNAGIIDVRTRTLNILDGAFITVETRGMGNAGNVSITATDTVLFSGTNNGNPSSVFSIVEFGALGNGGNVSINARSLSLTDGAQVASTTKGQGNAGSINIRLGQSLMLDGTGTLIAARTTPSSIGNGGSIFIDPSLVSITNGAGISVDSQGIGNGGNIDIFAGKFFFANKAFISANTASGEGGNINLQIADIFFPRNHSQITATAGNNGNGGNINLSALFLVSVPSENNDIFANAFFGKGGNINITTQAIFGFQSRPRLTPLSDITASSDYGVQGNVNLNTLGIDPSKGLSNLPVDVSDPSRLVTQRCIADQRGNEFIITGKGGVPANPSDRPTDTGVLDNFGSLSDRNNTTNLTSSATPQPTTTPDAIVEATGWIVNAQNQVVLVAGTTPAQPNIRCPR